jgi:hypothetical protein
MSVLLPAINTVQPLLFLLYSSVGVPTKFAAVRRTVIGIVIPVKVSTSDSLSKLIQLIGSGITSPAGEVALTVSNIVLLSERLVTVIVAVSELPPEARNPIVSPLETETDPGDTVVNPTQAPLF